MTEKSAIYWELLTAEYSNTACIAFIDVGLCPYSFCVTTAIILAIGLKQIGVESLFGEVLSYN